MWGEGEGVQELLKFPFFFSFWGDKKEWMLHMIKSESRRFFPALPR